MSGYFDALTSLAKFGMRYDDTTTGCWTQHMPVGSSLLEMTKANPYMCTADNPVNVVDPTGRDVNQAINCVAALIGNIFVVFGADIALAPVILGLGLTPLGVIVFILAAIGGGAYLLQAAYQNCGQYIT